MTDGSGPYRIEQLRPGVYVVTFTLAGFSVVRREGIELQDEAVATVNAALRVGGARKHSRSRVRPRPWTSRVCGSSSPA